MSHVRRVVRNIFSNWATLAITAIVGFCLAPLVVRSLGDDRYGIWILALSLTGHMGILDFGLRPIIVKFVTHYQELGDNKRTNEIINTTLVGFSLIGLLVVLASLVLAHFAQNMFVVEPEFVSELKVTIFLIGLTLALKFPFGVFGSIHHAFQRFDLNNMIVISVFLVRSVCIVTALMNGGGLIELASIVLIAAFVEHVIVLVYSFRIYPKLKLDPRLASRNSARTISGFGGYTFIIQVANRISYQTDPIILGAFLGTASITSYSIGATLAEYLVEVVALIAVAIVPVAASFEARADTDKLKHLFSAGTKYSLLIILPIGLTYIVAGESFINIWMGPEYGPTSSTVLAILTFSFFGVLSQKVSISILFAMGRVKFLSLIVFGAAVINIVLSVILVKKIGIYGVAIGTAIPNLLYGSLILPVYTCHALSMGYRHYLMKAVLPPIIASLPFLLMISLSERWFELDSFPKFGMHLTAALLVYAVFVFLLVLEPEHREMITTRVRVRSGEYLRRRQV